MIDEKSINFAFEVVKQCLLRTDYMCRHSELYSLSVYSVYSFSFQPPRVCRRLAAAAPRCLTRRRPRLALFLHVVRHLRLLPHLNTLLRRYILHKQLF